MSVLFYMYVIQLLLYLFQIQLVYIILYMYMGKFICQSEQNLAYWYVLVVSKLNY